MIQRARRIGSALIVLLVVGACGSGISDYEIILDGLNEPRGVWILTDGTLCVAEAGSLAEGQTVREGPTAHRAETGSVSCVDAGGTPERIIEHLPYVFYNVTGVTTGPADVAEMDGELYLLTGEGEGHLARKLINVTDRTPPPEVVADFWEYAGATAQPNLLDEVNVISNPFAMIPDPGNRRMLVADGATGHVMGAGLDGDIVLFSEVQGHEVLTGIARGPDGLVYVASFSQLPHAKGDGAILRLSPDGSSAVVVDNLTTPIDLAFDTSGRLYVLEFIDDTGSSDPYRDRVGRLLRHDPRGDGWASGVVLVQNLPFPTALLVDGHDRIYISVHGAFSGPNTGLVLRFDELATRPLADQPIEFVDGS